MCLTFRELFGFCYAVIEKSREVMVEEYYTEAPNCHYLQITIRFQKEDVID